MWNWNWFLNVSEPGIPNNQTSNTIGFSGNGEPEHNKCLLGEKKHPDLFLVGTGFPGVFDGDLCCISAWSSTRASRQACRTKAGWMKGQKRLLIGNLKLRRLRLILSSRSSIGLRALWWKKMHHSSSDCLALFVDLDLQGHCYVQSRMYRFYHVFLGQTVRQRSNPDPSGLIHWDGVRGQSILVD